MLVFFDVQGQVNNFIFDALRCGYFGLALGIDTTSARFLVFQSLLGSLKFLSTGCFEAEEW